MMTYIPIIWLILCVAVAPRRPGFLLGCAIIGFQFDSLYNAEIIGLSLNALALSFTILVAIYHRRWFVPNASDYLMMLFSAMYAISAAYSPDIGGGLNIAGRFIAYCFGFYIIGRFYSTISNYRDQYIFDFGASVVFLSLVFGYFAVSQQQTPDRLTLGEGSAVGFSQMLDIAGGFTLFYLLSISGNFAWTKRIVVFLLFAGVAVLIILNATRGTVIGLIVALSIYASIQILQRRSAGRNLGGIAALSLILSAAALIMLQFTAGTEFFSSAFERLGMNFGATGMEIDASAVSRLNLLRMAWDMFTESPLLGQGVGAFAHRSVLGYPHSLFPELLAETGLITTAVFTVILLRTLTMAFQLFKQSSPVNTIILGIFVILLVHQQVSFALWMAKPLFFSMGVIVSLYLRSESRLRLIPEKQPAGMFGHASRRSLPR